MLLSFGSDTSIQVGMLPGNPGRAVAWQSRESCCLWWNSSVKLIPWEWFFFTVRLKIPFPRNFPRKSYFGGWNSTSDKPDLKTEASFFSAKVLRESRGSSAEEYCYFDGHSGLPSLCISAMILEHSFAKQ